MAALPQEIRDRILHGDVHLRTYGYAFPFQLFATSRAFHRFGQAKLGYSGLVLGSSQFPLLPQQSQKRILLQNRLKNNHSASLIQIRDTLCKNRHWFMPRQATLLK